jgi:hypothetical protein
VYIWSFHSALGYFPDGNAPKRLVSKKIALTKITCGYKGGFCNMNIGAYGDVARGKHGIT